MKLIEAIVAIIILSVAIGGWVAVTYLSNSRISSYYQKLNTDAEQLSIQSYFPSVITTTWSSYTGSLALSGNVFLTGALWKYPYSCVLKNGTFANTTTNYTWVFCDITIQDKKYYSYKLQ